MDLLFEAIERPESAHIDETLSADGDESTTTDTSDATVDTAEAIVFGHGGVETAAAGLAFLRAPTGHLKGVRELSDGRYKAWGARDVPLGVFDDASTAALAVSRYVEQKKRSRPLQAWGAAKQMRPASNGDFFW